MNLEIFNQDKENMVGNAVGGKHQNHVSAETTGAGVKHMAAGRTVLGEIKQETNQQLTQENLAKKASEQPEPHVNDHCRAFQLFLDSLDDNLPLAPSSDLNLPLSPSRFPLPPSPSSETSVTHVDDLDLSFASSDINWNEAIGLIEDDFSPEVPRIINDCVLNLPDPSTSDLAASHDDTDYLTAPEYMDDIYKFLRSQESLLAPRHNYMSYQPDVTHTMRSILVDWLVEVAVEYRLSAATLHLTVSFIDRFMSVMAVERSKLQLVGAVSMYLAAKVEEIHPPHVSDFVYITDDSFTVKQMLRMEQLILNVLKFLVSGPTSHGFMTSMCTMFSLSPRATSLATYINELTLVDGDTFLKFSPSMVAAGSVALALDSLGEEDAWSDDMVARTGYALEDLVDCFVKLREMFRQADQQQLQAVRGKYKSEEFHSVAFLIPHSIDH